MGATDYLLRKLRGQPFDVTSTITRPNDTTAYAAGDVISNATSGATMMSWSNVHTIPGGWIELHKVIVYDSACQTTKPDMGLRIFDTTIATAPVDNAAISLTDSEAETMCEFFQLAGTAYGVTNNATSGAGGNFMVITDPLGRVLKLASGATSLYGVLSVQSAYTPVANETFKVRLIGFRLFDA